MFSRVIDPFCNCIKSHPFSKLPKGLREFAKEETTVTEDIDYKFKYELEKN